MPYDKKYYEKNKLNILEKKRIFNKKNKKLRSEIRKNTYENKKEDYLQKQKEYLINNYEFIIFKRYFRRKEKRISIIGKDKEKCYKKVSTWYNKMKKQSFIASSFDLSDMIDIHRYICNDNSHISYKEMWEDIKKYVIENKD